MTTVLLDARVKIDSKLYKRVKAESEKLGLTVPEFTKYALAKVLPKEKKVGMNEKELELFLKKFSKNQSKFKELSLDELDKLVQEVKNEN
jgi:hypothetical protein